MISRSGSIQSEEFSEEIYECDSVMTDGRVFLLPGFKKSEFREEEKYSKYLFLN